jgi:hypothetical protein
VLRCVVLCLFFFCRGRGLVSCNTMLAHYVVDGRTGEAIFLFFALVRREARVRDGCQNWVRYHVSQENGCDE